MKREDVASLTLKVLGAFTFVKAVRSLPWAWSSCMALSGRSGNLLISLGMFGALLLPFGISAVLFFKSRGLAARLTRPKGGLEGNEHLYIGLLLKLAGIYAFILAMFSGPTLVRAIGLYFTFTGLPSLPSSLVPGLSLAYALPILLLSCLGSILLFMPYKITVFLLPEKEQADPPETTTLDEGKMSAELARMMVSSGIGLFMLVSALPGLAAVFGTVLQLQVIWPSPAWLRVVSPSGVGYVIQFVLGLVLFFSPKGIRKLKNWEWRGTQEDDKEA